MSDVVRETRVATYKEDEKMNIFEKIYEDATKLAFPEEDEE